MLPATMTLAAFSGGINVASGGSLYPSATGNLKRSDPSGKQSSYDVNSPFQIVGGAGTLNQAADRYLTQDEKAELQH